VAVPGPHLVDCGLVSVEGHQVGVLSTHLPAGVVGVDHGGTAHPSPQFLVFLPNIPPGSAQGILGNGPLGQFQPSQQP
jgi:hypothetical protein